MGPLPYIALGQTPMATETPECFRPFKVLCLVALYFTWPTASLSPRREGGPFDNVCIGKKGTTIIQM